MSPELNLPTPAAGPPGFGDLPSPRSAAPAPTARRKAESLPGSLFDDIPLPAAAGGGAPLAAAPSLDLDGLDLASPVGGGGGGGEFELSRAAPMPAPPRGAAPMLDLGDGGGGGNGDAFGDLDLPMPNVGPGAASAAAAEPAQGKGPVRFSSSPKMDDEVTNIAKMPELTVSPSSGGGGGKDLSLDLEGETHEDLPPGFEAPKKNVSIAPPSDEQLQEKRKLSPKAKKIIAGTFAGVVALGLGGVTMYKRHAAAQERAVAIGDGINRARRALLAGDLGHWQRAQVAAKQVLATDSKNADGLGILAEAAFAGYLEEGTGGATRVSVGRDAITQANEGAILGPAIDRAKALQPLVTGQPERAVQALGVLAKANPTDASLALYLAWAHFAAGQYAETLRAVEPAIRDATRKAPALYVRGQARLATSDLAGAKKDFSGVLEIVKDHIGAQVGLAASLPPTMAAQREADIMAILARKDIDQADPRAVTLAWALAGDDARRAGRLDPARDRYRKALTMTMGDLRASLGMVETELLDGKLDVAEELLRKVEVTYTNNTAAAILSADLALRRGRLEEAGKKVNALLQASPPLANPAEAARAQMLSGQLLEKQGRDEDAMARMRDAVNTAGERDLAPLVSLVNLLGRMAQKADARKDLAKASELRDAAEQALAPLAGRAEKEPELTVIVGVAYLSAGDAPRAENWLRKATAARPNDVEAYFQLAEAVKRQNRELESIEILRKAFELDPARSDVGVSLARTYEALERNDDATQMYDRLLSAKDASLELRARAGRFFARLGQVEKAAVQGSEILKVQPEGNAAGFYLRGEGELAKGKLDDARRSFVKATESERDPQYLDALGRAAEALSNKTGDTKFDEEALRAYTAANDAAPEMYNPLAGRGRLLIKRRDAIKALDPLLAANKLKPNDGDVLYAVGVAYQLLKQPKAAMTWLAKSAKVRPDAEAFNRLGRLYFDNDQTGEAASALWEAARLGKEWEREQKLTLSWLTEAYYIIGRIESDRHNNGAAAKAWSAFIDRNPPNPAQVEEVKRFLLNNK